MKQDALEELEIHTIDALLRTKTSYFRVGVSFRLVDGQFTTVPNTFSFAVSPLLGLFNAILQLTSGGS